MTDTDRRVDIGALKHFTGSTHMEQVFSLICAGRLPEPLSFEPLEWDLFEVHAAIEADDELRNRAPWSGKRRA